MTDIGQLKSELVASGQSHLCKYWDDLSSENKDQYVKELASLKLDRINSAYKVFF